MRDPKAPLPASVSRAAIRQEFEYYGFHNDTLASRSLLDALASRSLLDDLIVEKIREGLLYVHHSLYKPIR